MAEGSGVGPEVAIAQKPKLIDRFKRVVGLSPKAPQNVPSPTTPTQQPDTLRQIVQGVQDPNTGQVRSLDASWKGPGVGQDDRRLMGEARASSPGGQLLDIRQAEEGVNAPTPRLTFPQSSESSPTYVVPGTEQDNQPIISRTAEPGLQNPAATQQETAQPGNPTEISQAKPDNVVPFPKPVETPVENPAA